MRKSSKPTAQLSVTFSSAIWWDSLLLGVIYGTTRILQGWQYMSHTFWAEIFVWLACLLTALALYGRARLALPVRCKSATPATLRQSESVA